MILIYRFSETIPIAIGNEVSSSYKLQLPSAAPSIPISPAALSIPSSPSPQLPNSQVREAVEAVVPLVPAGAAPAAWSPLFYTVCPTGSTGEGVRCAPHYRRADRSCGSSTLEA